MLISHKFLDDAFLLNSAFANIAGLELEELNYLEEVFLEILDFDIFVSPEEFKEYRESLNTYFLDGYDTVAINQLVVSYQDLLEREVM